MIKIIHLSDIHLGSGFTYGHLNPKTGLNTRFEDFINTLSLCIDRAVREKIDLVLFGGDAFPDATPPPYVQEAFASQFHRLADAKIPTILLVGNHDQHSQGDGGASLCIYRTLGVPGFIVGDTLKTNKISTKNGEIQVITLPWLTHCTLFTRRKTDNLSFEEVQHLLIESLTLALEGEIRQLDPQLPTILLGHLMADRANLGAEKFLAVGKGFTIPMSLLIRPEFDYVALGHVHKHQNLNPTNDPPVIYSGSIERVDFSEEKEDKGYIYLEINKGKVDWQFNPLPSRNFCSININVSEEFYPQFAILKAIQKKSIQNSVVRLIYKIRSEQLELINTGEIYEALEESHSYTIRPELVSQLSRSRLPELGVGNNLDPISALQAYLDSKEDLKEIVKDMLETAKFLLNNNDPNLDLSVKQKILPLEDLETFSFEE
ncbi:MAG: exonuclease subunit SbcD [cyanobacterium endosymbiont of Rhopalodia musculus]|uniref:exonuclease subunit SbcD n=1 Tax=cyanobacterium endosymbiont of Epithemia clementina EcSB TaxID=3034674 RepID=UPI00247FA39D|nr:exonuclease subunit SbcD [cyanobacterium endosymbiont of Epithemia clementina EcSB]WGT67884.1 exonuclease subunit SbcD [cyanobacterium endosymbiont of Epithemia clementina EcSB]